MGKENEPPVTPEVIEGRLEQFALAVLRLSRPLLAEQKSRDTAVQLRRAATGAFSNYGAARVARSHADFTSKIGVALEEADESRRWLRLLKAADILDDADVDAVIGEAGGLSDFLCVKRVDSLGASYTGGRSKRSPYKIAN